MFESRSWARERPSACLYDSRCASADDAGRYDAGAILTGWGGMEVGRSTAVRVEHGVGTRLVPGMRPSQQDRRPKTRSRNVRRCETSSDVVNLPVSHLVTWRMKHSLHPPRPSWKLCCKGFLVRSGKQAALPFAMKIVGECDPRSPC